MLSCLKVQNLLVHSLVWVLIPLLNKSETNLIYINFTLTTCFLACSSTIFRRAMLTIFSARHGWRQCAQTSSLPAQLEQKLCPFAQTIIGFLSWQKTSVQTSQMISAWRSAVFLLLERWKLVLRIGSQRCLKTHLFWGETKPESFNKLALFSKHSCSRVASTSMRKKQLPSILSSSNLTLRASGFSFGFLVALIINRNTGLSVIPASPS